MKPKTLKILYWIITIFFCLVMLMDGIAGLAQQADGQKAMHDLHYPNYLMFIVGTAKVLGAFVLLVPGMHILKEWAYAGFTFNFLGAAASWAFAGDTLLFVLPPLISLLVMFASYYLWRRLEKLKAKPVQA